MPRPSLVAAAIALPVLAWAGLSAYLNGPRDEVEAAFSRTSTAAGRTDAYLDAHYAFDPAQRDSALALVTPAHLADFAYTWRALDACTYTRRSRTEQRTRDDLLLNAVEREAAHTGARGRLVRQDSTAPFDFGYFSRYVSLNAETYDPLHVEALAAKALVVLAPGEERYVVRTSADTLLASGPARIVDVEARPGVGDGLNVRRVRVFFDRAGQRIVGLDVRRIDLGDLHREEATLEAMLAPDAYGRLLPHSTRFLTTGKVPFREPMRFETAALYADFACPERAR